jgi:hypothetical protein
MNPFLRMIFTKNEHFSLSFHLFWNQTRRKKKEERKKKKEQRTKKKEARSKKTEQRSSLLR